MATTYPLTAIVDYETGAIHGLGCDLAHARADARKVAREAGLSESDTATWTDARITEAAAEYVRAAGGAPSPDLKWGRIPDSHIQAIRLRSEDE